MVERYDPKLVYLRSTFVDRTINSLYSELATFFPKDLDFQVSVGEEGYDPLSLSDCGYWWVFEEHIMQVDETLLKYENERQRIEGALNISDTDKPFPWFKMADLFLTRESIQLPPYEDISREQIDLAYELKEHFWAQEFNNENRTLSDDFNRMNSGAFLKMDFIPKLLDDSVKVTIFSAHDDSVGGLLAILWPEWKGGQVPFAGFVAAEIMESGAVFINYQGSVVSVYENVGEL